MNDTSKTKYDGAELEAELRRAYAAFSESRNALRSFAELTQESISAKMKQIAGIRESFADISKALAEDGSPAAELQLPQHEVEELRESFRRRPGYRVQPRAVGPAKLELSEEDFSVADIALDRYRELVVQFPTMFADMSLIYLVALFEAFTFDCFCSVLVSRPEMLRDRKRQMSYDAILSSESHESLIVMMANRELHEASYKSLKDRHKYFEHRFGVDLGAAEGVSVQALEEITARRNLLVHNAGVINEVYLSQVAVSELEIGARVVVDDDYWADSLAQISAAARAVISGLTKRFGLQLDAIRRT